MATSIKNVTVLGAGVLGAQIAFQSAYAGFNVVSYDISDDALKAAQDRFESIKKSYKTALPDEATDEKLSEASGRITQTADLEEAVKEADLVIEAVPEKIDLKKKVWTDVGKAAPEHTIFTSNTSTLLPSSFADASGAPERFLSFHFANRLWVQRLAEIMPTEKTDEKYVEELEASTRRSRATSSTPCSCPSSRPARASGPAASPTSRTSTATGPSAWA